MDRFDVIKFEDLTGPRGGEWVKIGGGSFGVVFRGEYLGTEVAIKEVLPNNTYDVEKYFERECVLMKEARHPNIVQYIGLTKSPGPNGRIYIISEFVGGNLRSYIADKKKPFDWPLRVSFATDIARAVAYLHARNCLHRDLKGENLLITANDRIKVCDFGFARIAARNEEEMRRISYCGTDGYMSPEILMGIDFSLPSDIFSLGIIFCEIISRHLVDPTTFKRQMPSFGLEEDEVREMASKGCPVDFIQLSIDCCKVEPIERPDMRQIIKRLRLIEQEVIQHEFKKGTLRNVGSLRGMNEVFNEKGARGKAPRLPSFEAHIQTRSFSDSIPEEPRQRSGSEDSSDAEMEDALQALENVTLHISGDEKSANKMALDTIKVAGTFKISGHGNPWWDEDSQDSLIDIPQSWLKARPVPPTPELDKGDDYSTAVVRPSKMHKSSSSLSSKLSAAEVEEMVGSNVTVRHHRTILGDADINSKQKGHARDENVSEAETLQSSKVVMHLRDDLGEEVTQSYMTAHSSHDDNHCDHIHDPSLAVATLASSIYEQALLYHRFTLVKSGTKRTNNSINQTIDEQAASSSSSYAWSESLFPAQLLLANALTKCNVCNKRLGFGSYMDCDDCPYKTHVGCAAMAEPNCQELQLPHSGGNSPAMGTPLNLATASRRDSLSLSPSTAAPALRNVVNGNIPSTTTSSKSPAKREKEAKSPPSSFSRGVNLFRKKQSKSPPPNSPIHPAISA